MKFKIGDTIRWTQCSPGRVCISCTSGDCLCCTKQSGIGTISGISDSEDHTQYHVMINGRPNGWCIDDCYAEIYNSMFDKYKANLLKE